MMLVRDGPWECHQLFLNLPFLTDGPAYCSDECAYNFWDSVCLTSFEIWSMNATSHSSSSSPLNSDLLNEAYNGCNNNNDHNNDNIYGKNLPHHISNLLTYLCYSDNWRRIIDLWGICLLFGNLKFLTQMDTVGGVTLEMDPASDTVWVDVMILQSDHIWRQCNPIKGCRRNIRLIAVWHRYTEQPVHSEKT